MNTLFNATPHPSDRLQKAILAALETEMKQIVEEEAKKALAVSLRCALAHMRQLANLPLEPYERNVQLDHVDHAGKELLDAAKRLGIDMGAEWQNQLDLRDRG